MSVSKTGVQWYTSGALRTFTMLCSRHHSLFCGTFFSRFPPPPPRPQQILYSPEALPVPPLPLTTFNPLISECLPISWISPVNADEQNHRRGGFIRLCTYFKSRLGNSHFLFPFRQPLCIGKGSAGDFKMSSAK